MNYGRQNLIKAQKKQELWIARICKMFIWNTTLSLITILTAICFISAFFLFGVLNGIFQSSPSISTLDVVPVGYATVIYDSDGKKMTQLVAEDSNRSYVNEDQISQALKDAIVAIEDERFYEHNGIDFQGIGRAFMVGVAHHFDFSEGASTITQQLLKNNVFTEWVNEASFSEKIKRKLQEQYLAIQLEKKMDKDRILELYMNTINLGQNTLGVQAASLRYFNKPASELTISEAAVIAAIPQNPSKFNPIRYPENNALRRQKVLDNMLAQGYITKAEYDEAVADDVYSRIQKTNKSKAKEEVYTYFVDALTEQVVKDLQEEKGLTEDQAINLLYSGGLQIYSTQDSRIQKICDEIYQDEANYPANTQWLLEYQLTVEDEYGEQKNYSSESLEAYIKTKKYYYNRLYYNKEDAAADIEDYKASILTEGTKEIAETIFMTPQPQVSLTVEDQNTGFIVAMIGGRGEKVASRTLNRAANTTRQPGSCFKIVSTYAPAIDIGEFSLSSKQLDAPFCYKNGRPVANWWGSGYRGWLDLRYGIKMSCNIVTVKTLTDITPQVGFDYLQDLGFTTLVDSRETYNGGIVSDIGQPMALGGITDGVTNLELNAAYATIANGGEYLAPKLYSYILDHDGNVYLDWRDRKGEQVLHDSTAFLIIDAMKDVVRSGTGTACNFGNMAIAGKTGTTSDNKDVWFAGSTPYYTATTWTGYDNNVEMNAGTGTMLSKSMWRLVMSKIHEGLPYADWERPDSLVQMSLCPTCGKLRNGTGVMDWVDPNVLETCDGRHYMSTYAEIPTDEANMELTDESGENLNPNGEERVVCAYTGQTPCAECPYKIKTTGAVAPGVCPHSAEFMADPSADAVLETQLQEMKQQNAEAEAAVQQAQNEQAETAIQQPQSDTTVQQQPSQTTDNGTQQPLNATDIGTTVTPNEVPIMNVQQ